MQTNNCTYKLISKSFGDETNSGTSAHKFRKRVSCISDSPFWKKVTF